MYTVQLLSIKLSFNYLIQVKQEEYHFVWLAYKLVIEMAENMFWEWNAQKDPHGTSHGQLSLTYSRLYKTAFVKNKDSAQ